MIAILPAREVITIVTDGRLEYRQRILMSHASGLEGLIPSVPVIKGQHACLPGNIDRHHDDFTRD
jgi:hypothetical protein